MLGRSIITHLPCSRYLSWFIHHFGLVQHSYSHVLCLLSDHCEYLCSTSVLFGYIPNNYKLVSQD